MKLNFFKKYGIILGIFYIVILCFVVYRAWHPGCRFNRDHFTGNSFTEKRVLYGGECFYKEGFIKCRFLRICPRENSKEKLLYYTHFPPLPSLINGALRKIGFKNIFSFRLFPIFLSIVMVTMLYFLIKILFNDDLIALIGTIYTGMTPCFLLFADNLSYFLYNDLFIIGAILFFILFDKKSKKLYVVLIWLFAFLLSITSYEYIPFILGFFWGYYFIFKRNWSMKYLLIFSSSIFCGVALHFAQNVWALGSVKEAFLDHKIAFYYRTIGKLVGTPCTDTFPDLVLNKEVMKGLMPEIMRRIEYFFSIRPIVLLGSLFLLPFLYVGDKKKLRFYYKILGLLFFCGILWWVLFIQATAVHGFTGRNIMLFAILLVSILMKEGGYYIFKYPKKIFYRVAWITFLLLVIICSVFSRFIGMYYALFQVFIKTSV